ncbi:olfactory receptor 9A4 isoform X1 [Rousettus aegyptiacus]|uniref:olfactory receptor 9A4 isoform X1 n=2 Tax=Rousettus aegyptiacus TaxID=9407 RepID=UPI00168D6F34|nr:olfactory receptor 9A4 isoform X1 [Rousettus aegyptiacus]XP_036086694.1 olfactory receptor 9A4 isoform X1 [Rousettus aegyptiacus]
MLSIACHQGTADPVLVTGGDIRTCHQGTRMLGNHSGATEFYLLGFPGSKEQRHVPFATFFFLYSVTLMGNAVIITMVCVDRRLQSPVYFFLGHLSTLEILITSVIVPVMLWGLLLPGMQTISLAACVAQLFLYLAVGTTEFALLGAMAVDRYVAVCNPLRSPPPLAGGKPSRLAPPTSPLS